ncbi:MAG: DUF4347 domain-containing protein, partial [Planctomycetes bacterium]|nr:DUF4347 domain-containing protein [Planctomycetota bacterium]
KDHLGEDGARDKQKTTRKGNLPEKDLYVVSTGDPNDNGFCANAMQTLTEQGKPVVGADTIDAAKAAIHAKSQELGRKISVTMIGHGRPGSIKIGTERINKDTDSDQSGADFGGKIKNYCSSVTFFSCNTGEGDTGQTFLQNVANGLCGTASAWVETVTAAASWSFLGIRIYDGYFDVESGGKKGTDTAIDCNENGRTDSAEIAADPLLDMNGNGVIDSCEHDSFDEEPNEFRSIATPTGALADGRGIIGFSTGGLNSPGPDSLDMYLVTPAPRPRGIYRHRLYLNSPIPGHTATIRGLTQSGGVINPSSDTAVQTSNATTVPPNFTQWYGFGRSEPLYYRVVGTASTIQQYFVYMETEPVMPLELGEFPWGGLTISCAGQGHTSDTDLWVYDDQLRPIRGYGNDDSSGLQSVLSRPYYEGTYYLALSSYNLANNQASPPDDNFRSGSVLDFPGPVADSSTTASANLSFSITTADGTVYPFTANRQGPFDVLWFKFAVAGPGPAPCPADLNGDGEVGFNDLTILLSHFGLPATPNEGDLDGDGVVGINDLAEFLSAFGSTCG